MKGKAIGSYSGAKTSQISFPLGGIGSGCIGLAGDGRLVDWEIFNKPAKGSFNGFSHFAVKAVSEGKLLDARALCGELKPPYMGGGPKTYAGFGFGPVRENLAGLPNFLHSEFTGEYPIAKLDFKDPKFPGKASLTAFNPLIPLNDKDSSIPGAFFEVSFENTSSKKIDYTVAFTLRNPGKKSVNKAVSKNGLTLVRLSQEEKPSEDPGYGELAFGTDAKDAFVQECWYRGGWFDNLGIYWQDFAKAGPMPKRSYSEPADFDHATITATVSVKPKSKGSVRFVAAWHYPNCVNYWTKPSQPCDCASGCCDSKPKTWKNYYATVFKDAVDSASYSLKSWERLFEDTQLFKDALFSSEVPAPVIDAVSANISILKSPTVLRLEDGSFYGWEGCHCDSGCCEGSCTHVWNYAYALPFLFPKLERSMRDLNYKHNMRDDGGLVFRIKLPLGSDRGGFRPCCDGQFGDVVKVYRDWKISGDTKWLKSLWPSVKKSIEFAWAKSNEDKWDPGKTGVLEGRQHHTLDMELFGPNSWLTGMYLAALKAGAEMAEALGEPKTAKEYLGIFEKGKAWVDKNLFNGEYYIQKLDLGAKAEVEKFDALNYWNSEHKEIKYQIGEGCAADQLLGQWHSNLCGLGDIFDKAQRRKALKAMFKHNYKKSFRNFFNPCRLYTLNDEGGVVICDWPKGARKPVVPAPYSEETFYGIEYSVASLMIQEGLVKEGLEITGKVREKFDGERRNPWNEFECGSNYARSMASYALLNALSGFEFDATKGMIGFSPAGKESSFSSFWSLDSAWGTVKFSGRAIALDVLYGSLKLEEFRSARLEEAELKSVKAGGKTLSFEAEGGAVRLLKPAIVKAGGKLEIAF